MVENQANYLINTAPELKAGFIKTLQKIIHFSRLSEELLTQIFRYSRFFVLGDNECLIQKGSFGQNIFILIQGRLEIFLENESGTEEHVDVLFDPLRIFGEQCILGEPSNKTIRARGKVLLIGIDISALPDLLDGIENPDNRLEDTAYVQNKDMFLIFADVLNNRLNRLIKDQYKLTQKIVILHQSKEYQYSWKQNIILTTIFNEFSLNHLSPKLEVHAIVAEILSPYIAESEKLAQLLECRPVNTKHIYLEMVRLETLGIIISVSILTMEIIQILSVEALKLDEYTNQLEFQPHNLPGIIPLSEYLDEVYKAIIDSDILEKELSKVQFLDGFLGNSKPDPFSLEKYLQGGKWVTKQFNMAHLMYIICQTCINKELELNRLIADCISYLNNISAPRQNTESSRLKNIEQKSAIVEEIFELHQQTIGDENSIAKETPKTDQKQANVEDLLADFGL